MSVYKRGGVYWYDFWFRGIRYRESSGLTNKNAATDAESIRRAELAEGRAGIVHRGPVPKFEDFVKNEFMPWSEKQHETHPRTHQYYRMSSKPLIASLGNHACCALGTPSIIGGRLRTLRGLPGHARQICRSELSANSQGTSL